MAEASVKGRTLQRHGAQEGKGKSRALSCNQSAQGEGRGEPEGRPNEP